MSFLFMKVVGHNEDVEFGILILLCRVSELESATGSF